jgi:hypothetical protein
MPTVLSYTGRVVARSKNLRIIRAYNKRTQCGIRVVRVVGTTLIVEWWNGASMTTTFAEASALRNYVKGSRLLSRCDYIEIDGVKQP